MKVIALYLSRLRNNEHYRFLMEIISIVVKAIEDKIHNEAMRDNISMLLNMLKELTERLDKAIMALNKSELTEPVAQADSNRDMVYRGFTLHVQAFSHSMDEAKRESARRIQVLIGNYKDFRRRPLNEQSAIMDNFIQDLEAMQTENLNRINATEWVDAMRETNDALKNLMDERHNERVIQLREEVRELRSQADTLYYQICGMLEVGYTLDSGDGYADVIKEINERVSYYQTTLATRKGRADAAKEEETND